MIYKKIAYPLSISLLLFSSISEAIDNWQVHSYIEGGVSFLKGYSENPLSSPKRPTFSELDINSDLYCALGVELKYNTGTLFYLDYQQRLPSNTTILKSTLLTMGDAIAAGQLFAMDSHYKWISFGLGAEYVWVAPCLHFTPLIDLTWLDYSYHYSANTIESGYQSRTTALNSLVTVRLGAQLDYEYRDCLSSQITLMGSPPFLPLTMYEAKFTIAYHLYERNNFKIRPYVGLSWLFIDLDDNNANNIHARYEARPSLCAGFHFCM